MRDEAKERALHGVANGEVEPCRSVAAYAVKRIAELEGALRPWAFSDSANIRFVFTAPDWVTTPGGAAEFEGQVIGIISGPWQSHMDTPDLHHAVKDARDALGLGKEVIEK